MPPKISVYSEEKLEWVCGLRSVPVCLEVCQFGALKGLITTVDQDGNLAVNYLGTDPPNSIVSGKSLSPPPKHTHTHTHNTHNTHTKNAMAFALLGIIIQRHVTTQVTTGDKTELNYEEMDVEHRKLLVRCRAILTDARGMA
eukprot:SAG11_NODE_187_length_13061_cov_10.715322_14_plen_142_part_00